jgi:hypothetical protein
VPFRGDSSDLTTAGRWIGTFERLANDFDLNRNQWALQAVLSFPANSEASLWANSIFFFWGGGRAYGSIVPLGVSFVQHFYLSIPKQMRLLLPKQPLNNFRKSYMGKM